MRETNIRNLDLNLLVALNALLEEKQVTRAAERINLSQPAMSRALARLRTMFQDPLLIKDAKGMALTSRAQELYIPLQHILREITDMVSPPSIEPAQMQGEIVIATRDNILVTILPKVIDIITNEAPEIKLRIVPLIGHDLSPLEFHKVDFVLSATESESASLHRSILYEECFICMASSKYANLGGKITLEKFMSMKHCLVTISGFGTGVVDDYLSQKGLERNIVVRLPHFLAAGYLVAESDLIVTLPLRLAQLFAQSNLIALLEPPFQLPQFPIYLYWHRRNQNNPIHQWIKKIIKSSCNS
jgi:DNA-binding transcriptional LysR family regulator